MAKAYRCDRCPNLFEKHERLSTKGEVYETQSKFYRIKFTLNVSDYDDSDREPELCSSCHTDMKNAITAKIQGAE